MTNNNNIREVKVYMFEKDYETIVKAYEFVREEQQGFKSNPNKYWTINTTILEALREYFEIVPVMVSEEEGLKLLEYERKNDDNG